MNMIEKASHQEYAQEETEQDTSSSFSDMGPTPSLSMTRSISSESITTLDSPPTHSYSVYPSEWFWSI